MIQYEVAFTARAAAARAALLDLEGDGWMTSSARDLVRIAAFAGFDVQELKLRVALSTSPDRMVNAASVDRVMGEMWAEFPAVENQKIGA